LLIFQAGKESEKLAEPEEVLQHVHTKNAITITSVQQGHVKQRAGTPLASFLPTHVSGNGNQDKQSQLAQ
jgi:hypothetical protein